MDETTIADEGQGGGHGRAGHRPRSERLTRAGGQPEGLSLAQIASEVGLARSTVQRIVAALAAEEFVTEAQPGRGVANWRRSCRASRLRISSNLTEILHPHLPRLREEVGETVDLSVLSGGSAFSSTRFRVNSGWSRYRPSANDFLCTARPTARQFFLLQQTGRGRPYRQELAEHPDHPSPTADACFARSKRHAAASRLRYRRAYRWHQRRRRRYARRLRTADRDLDTCALATIRDRAGLPFAGARRLS